MIEDDKNEDWKSRIFDIANYQYVYHYLLFQNNVNTIWNCVLQHLDIIIYSYTCKITQFE